MNKTQDSICTKHGREGCFRRLTDKECTPMNKQTCRTNCHCHEHGKEVTCRICLLESCEHCRPMNKQCKPECKQTCTCKNIINKDRLAQWKLASHAMNCPLYEGFNKKEFERQAEEVQKTFQEACTCECHQLKWTEKFVCASCKHPFKGQDWEKGLTYLFALFGNETKEKLYMMIRDFIHTHDKEAREQERQRILKLIEDEIQYNFAENKNEAGESLGRVAAKILQDNKSEE